jgi:DNA-binding response OmpR family regulator
VSLGQNILIADLNAQQTVLLAQFLMSKDHVVETCDNAVEALQAIKKRTRREAPYDGLILHARLPGLPVSELVERLLALDQVGRLALILPANGLAPGEEAQIRNLGCRQFLSSPINFNQIHDFLQSLLQNSTADTPFFGTARLGRSGTGVHKSSTSAYQVSSDNEQVLSQVDDDPFSQADRQQANQPGTNYYRRAHSASYGRQGNVDPLPPPTNNGPMAGGLGPDGTPQTDGYRHQTSVFSTSYHRNKTSSTQRIRRSITGSYSADEGERTTSHISTSMQQVRCAHCAQVFAVPRRPDEYNTVCVHCGQLNRILPA